MTPTANIIISSFQLLVSQLVVWIPKLLIALVIWYVGKYFLALAIKWLKKIDVPGTKLDEKLIKKFGDIFLPAGKFLLFLIVLDYLGIGQSLISAFASGLTFAVAIALGIAFGKALEPDAKETVEKLKKYIK